MLYQIVEYMSMKNECVPHPHSALLSVAPGLKDRLARVHLADDAPHAPHVHPLEHGNIIVYVYMYLSLSIYIYI